MVGGTNILRQRDLTLRILARFADVFPFFNY
jgi:hypothetical protein